MSGFLGLSARHAWQHSFQWHDLSEIFVACCEVQGSTTRLRAYRHGPVAHEPQWFSSRRFSLFFPEFPASSMRLFPFSSTGLRCSNPLLAPILTKPLEAGLRTHALRGGAPERVRDPKADAAGHECSRQEGEGAAGAAAQPLRRRASTNKRLFQVVFEAVWRSKRAFRHLARSEIEWVS